MLKESWGGCILVLKESWGGCILVLKESWGGCILVLKESWGSWYWKDISSHLVGHCIDISTRPVNRGMIIVLLLSIR